MLVGPSGCGKTTAMRMVNRLIEITSGDILIAGQSVKDRKPAQLRREIGYAIQQIGLFPHETIAQNIATVPRLLGLEEGPHPRPRRRAARPDRRCPTRSATATRHSSPAASASASAWRARSPPTRRCC